jgi:hypothetical protein
MAGNLSFDSAPTAQQPRPPRSQYPQAQYPQAQYPQAQYPQPQYPQPPAAHAQPPHPPRPEADQRPARYPLGIDPEIWPLIVESAARLSRIEDTFVQELHHDVLKLILDPTGAPAPDIWAFCERTVQSLLWVALNDQPLGVIADTLRRVGAQNWVDGYPDSLYTNFTHALVQTVHYLSETDWSASTCSAWISYFMWAKPHLLAGAQQAAAERTAAHQAAARHSAAQRAVAEQEAARVEALSRDIPGGHVADVNLESVASLLDDDDDEDTGYGQIMLGMTRPRRDPPRLAAKPECHTLQLLFECAN